MVVESQLSDVLTTSKVHRLYFSNTNRQMHTLSGRLQLKAFNLQPLPIHLPPHPTHTRQISLWINLGLCWNNLAHQETRGGVVRAVSAQKLNMYHQLHTATPTYAWYFQMQKGHTQARVWVFNDKNSRQSKEQKQTMGLGWGVGGYRTCTTDDEEFLSANVPGNVLRSSETHLISKTSGMHRCRSRFSWTHKWGCAHREPPPEEMTVKTK